MCPMYGASLAISSMVCCLFLAMYCGSIETVDNGYCSSFGVSVLQPAYRRDNARVVVAIPVFIFSHSVMFVLILQPFLLVCTLQWSLKKVLYWVA